MDRTVADKREMADEIARATTIPSFNPSGREEVDTLKAMVEAVMEFVRDLEGDMRCKSIALTKLEEASMWGVKSLFVK